MHVGQPALEEEDLGPMKMRSRPREKRRRPATVWVGVSVHAST